LVLGEDVGGEVEDAGGNDEGADEEEGVEGKDAEAAAGEKRRAGGVGGGGVEGGGGGGGDGEGGGERGAGASPLKQHHGGPGSAGHRVAVEEDLVAEDGEDGDAADAFERKDDAAEGFAKGILRGARREEGSVRHWGASRVTRLEEGQQAWASIA